MPLVKLSQSLNFDTINTANLNHSVPDSMWSNSFNFHVARENEQQRLDIQKKKLSIPVEQSVINDTGYPIEPRNNVNNNNTPYNAALQTPFAGLPGMNFPYPGVAPNSMLQQPPIGSFPPSCFQLPQQPEDIFRNAFDNQLANCFMRSHEANALVFPMIDSVSPELIMILSAQQQVLSQIPAYSQNHMLSYNSMINKPIENMNSRQFFFEKFLSKPLTTVKSSISDSHNGIVAEENQREAGRNSILQHNILQNNKSLLYHKKCSEKCSTSVNLKNSSNLTHAKQADKLIQKKPFYPEKKCNSAVCNASLPICLNEISQTLIEKSGVKTAEKLLDQQEQNTNSSSNIDEKLSNTSTYKSSKDLFPACTSSQLKEPNEEDLDVNVDVVSDDEMTSTIKRKTNDDTLIYDVTNSEMEQVHFKKKMCRKFVPEEDDTNACEPEVKRIRLSSPQVIKQQTANTEVQNKKVPVNKTKTTQRSTILNQNGDLCFTNSPFNLDNLDVPNEKIKLNKQSTFSTKQVLRSSFLVKSCKDDEICDFKLKQSNAYTVEKAVEPTSSYRNSLEQHRTSSESCQDISDVEDRFNDQIFAEDVTDSSSAEESDCDVLPKPKVQAIIKNSKVLESTSESFVMTKPKFFIPRKKFASNGALFTKSIDKRLQPSINESNFTVRQATFNFKPLTKKTNKTICLENESISSTLSRNVLSFKESKANSNKFDTCLMTVNCTKNQNKRKQKRPKGRKPETFVLSAKLKHRFCNNTVVSSEETTQSELNEAFEKSKYTKKAEACVSDSLVSKEHSEEYSEINCNLKPNLKKKLNNTIKELKHKNTVEKQKKAHKSKKSSDTYEVMTSFNNKDLIPLSTSLKNSEDILTVSLTNNSCSGVVMGSSNCSMNLFTKHENFKVKRPTTLTKFSLEKAIPILPSITCGIGKCELVTASSVSNKKHQSRVWSRGQTALDVKARKQQEEWRNMKLSDFCMPGNSIK